MALVRSIPRTTPEAPNHKNAAVTPPANAKRDSSESKDAASTLQLGSAQCAEALQDGRYRGEFEKGHVSLTEGV